MIKLRKDYQLPLKNKIMQAWETVRGVLAVCPTGGGKCLGKGTLVLMLDGSTKKVEDVVQGDLLMGPDSKPRTVLSTCKGVEQLYSVTPVKGDPYIVNESHILSLKKTGTDEVVNINVLDYLASSNNFKHTHKGWRTGVEYPAQELDAELPPYLLGLWLGDGASRMPSITTADVEHVEYLEEFCASHGYPLRSEVISETNAAKTYHIKGNGQHKGTVMSALRKNNLILNKHIPAKYLTSSRSDRLELLAGLVDSDGYLHHNSYDFVFKSKKLAEDTTTLARSLGFAAYLKKCRKTCTNNGVAGTYWRFMISGDLHEVPVIVPRRKATARKQRKSVLMTGLTVEPTEVGEYYGFEIDGDRLFMLGDFTVTHNTIIFSAIMHGHVGASAAVVHRKEIVGQISLSLATLGLKHRIIAPPPTIAAIRKKHLKKFGRSFVDQHAQCGVISVQTLTSKSSSNNAQLQAWLNQVTLCVYDEGHHYVKTGLWAKAIDCMKNAKLLFVSATPERADGKGLGIDSDGFADTMVEGPTTRWLIDEGYLSAFTYKAPQSDFDVRDLAVTASGDFNSNAFRARVIESHLVGDVVRHYKKFAHGMRAIVFATDVATAEDMAEAFKAEGYTSMALSGATESAIRDRALEDYANGTIQVLVNVDLFDEGFDVPAVECVILARPTQSLGKYLQMIGRGLRVVYAPGYDLTTKQGRLAAIKAGGKTAVILDPVRNWERHGMPDWPRNWTLKGKEKGERSDGDDTIPQKVCKGCTGPYPAFLKACPYCGHVPEITARSLPEQVDGDLLELDVEAMAALFNKMNKADMSDDEYKLDQIARHIPAVGRGADLKRHRAAKYRREVLRNFVAWWVGMQPEDRDRGETYKRFYLRFGVDIATAFTLNTKETDALIERIERGFHHDTA